MPGYNVEGPAAAFSNTLEGYLQNQFKNRLLEQESQQRAQNMALQAQEQQLRQAEFADRLRQSKQRDVLSRAGTLLPNDIPDQKLISDLREIGYGNLVPEAKPLPQAMPGIAALPLGPGGSPETSQPMGANPPQPVRFAGFPEQRQDEQDIEAARGELKTMPEGSPEARALRFAVATHFRRNLPAGSYRDTTPIGSLGDYLERFAPNHDPSQLTAEQYDKLASDYTKSKRPGGETTYSPEATDMSAWLHLAKGDLPNARTEGGPGNQTAVASRMAELQSQYQLPPLAANAASYKAWNTALSDQTKRASAMQATMNGADQTLDLVAKSSPGVVRTDSKWINETLNALNAGLTPATPLTDLEVKIYAAAREYAKTVTGSSASVAELSAAATQQATRLLNAAQSEQTLQAAVQAMRADMHSYVGGQVRQVDNLRKIISDVAGPPGATPLNPNQSLGQFSPQMTEQPARPATAPASGPGQEWQMINGVLHHNGKPY